MSNNESSFFFYKTQQDIRISFTAYLVVSHTRIALNALHEQWQLFCCFLFCFALFTLFVFVYGSQQRSLWFLAAKPFSLLLAPRFLSPCYSHYVSYMWILPCVEHRSGCLFIKSGGNPRWSIPWPCDIKCSLYKVG